MEKFVPVHTKELESDYRENHSQQHISDLGVCGEANAKDEVLDSLATTHTTSRRPSTEIFTPKWRHEFRWNWEFEKQDQTLM